MTKTQPMPATIDTHMLTSSPLTSISPHLVNRPPLTLLKLPLQALDQVDIATGQKLT
jgi:hypothetical protein